MRKTQVTMRKHKPLYGKGVQQTRTAFNDRHYGKGNWEIVFKHAYSLVDKPRVVSFEDGLNLIHDAYVDHFERYAIAFPEKIKAFVDQTSNIYEFKKTNIVSGLDFLAQEDLDDEHFFDIAIRKALNTKGLKFKGEELINIYDSRYEELLDPKKVPFKSFPLQKEESTVYTFFTNNQYVKSKIKKDVSVGSLNGLIFL